MKSYDPDKLRRLDPKLAGQLEEVMARKEAAEKASEGPEAAPSPALAPRTPQDHVRAPEETPAASEAPGEPPAPREARRRRQKPPRRSEFAEGWQEPLLPPEAYEVEGQSGLFGGGGSVAAPDPEEAEPSEVEALMAKLQRSLPFEEEALPDCKRSAEELSLLTWQEKSTRREDVEFAHPAEYDGELRGMSDRELGEAWGWLTKRRYRGLSARDQAVQREVYARSLGILDLYGLVRQPAVSAMLEEVLRGQGCRSAVALYVVALLEVMLVRGRMALRMSASDAHVLKGCAASTWWAAIRRLETLGIVQRVRTCKPGEHGSAPVQRNTNLYVLGGWWFEGRKDAHGDPVPGTTPLEQALGLQGKCVRREESPAARAATQRTLRPRRARRRAVNTRQRDRNRRRHRALPPRVSSTPEVARTADVLARARLETEGAAAEARDRRRAQALMRGELEAASVTGEPAALEVPLLPCGALEAAADTQVAQANRGEPEGEALRRELVRVMADPARGPEFNCRPVFGRQSRRGEPKEKFFFPNRPPLPVPQSVPPPSLTSPQASPTKAGDTSASRNGSLGVRARALDGGSSLRGRSHGDEPASLQDDPVIQRAFMASFGRQMPEQEGNGQQP